MEVHPRRPLVVCASHAPGLAADTTRAHGLEFRAGLEEARSMVESFGPELVVMFGSDHRRAYAPVIPTWSTVLSAEGFGDHGSPTGAYSIPADLAESLLSHLHHDGFDVAASRGVRLDHGFGDTLTALLGGIDRRPTLPIFINCATPPLSSPARAVALGDSVARFLRHSAADSRVLVIGSGGLSHSPPTLEDNSVDLTDEQRERIRHERRRAAADKIQIVWDTDMLAAFATNDVARLEDLDPEYVAQGGVGAHEIRTWLAAWAAGGRGPLSTIVYEPVRAWITGMAIVASSEATTHRPPEHEDRDAG